MMKYTETDNDDTSVVLSVDDPDPFLCPQDMISHTLGVIGPVYEQRIQDVLQIVCRIRGMNFTLKIGLCITRRQIVSIFPSMGGMFNIYDYLQGVSAYIHVARLRYPDFFYRKMVCHYNLSCHR